MLGMDKGNKVMALTTIIAASLAVGACLVSYFAFKITPHPNVYWDKPNLPYPDLELFLNTVIFSGLAFIVVMTVALKIETDRLGSIHRFGPWFRFYMFMTLVIVIAIPYLQLLIWCGEWDRYANHYYGYRGCDSMTLMVVGLIYGWIPWTFALIAFYQIWLKKEVRDEKRNESERRFRPAPVPQDIKRNETRAVLYSVSISAALCLLILGGCRLYDRHNVDIYRAKWDAEKEAYDREMEERMQKTREVELKRQEEKTSQKRSQGNGNGSQKMADPTYGEY